jgi:hypothetical protein
MHSKYIDNGTLAENFRATEYYIVNAYGYLHKLELVLALGYSGQRTIFSDPTKLLWDAQKISFKSHQFSMLSTSGSAGRFLSSGKLY